MSNGSGRKGNFAMIGKRLCIQADPWVDWIGKLAQPPLNPPPTMDSAPVQKLKEMVQVVKQHLRGYLPDIIELIKQFWRLREAAVLRRGSGAERTLTGSK